MEQIAVRILKYDDSDVMEDKINKLLAEGFAIESLMALPTSHRPQCLVALMVKYQVKLTL